MNDFMNDINNPEPDRNTVIPVKKPDYSGIQKERRKHE